MKRKDPTELNAVHFNIQTYRIVKAVVQRSTFVRLVWFEELFDSVVLLIAFFFWVHLLHCTQAAGYLQTRAGARAPATASLSNLLSQVLKHPECHKHLLKSFILYSNGKNIRCR